MSVQYFRLTKPFLRLFLTTFHFSWPTGNRNAKPTSNCYSSHVLAAPYFKSSRVALHRDKRLGQSVPSRSPAEKTCRHQFKHHKFMSLMAASRLAQDNNLFIQEMFATSCHRLNSSSPCGAIQVTAKLHFHFSSCLYTAVLVSVQSAALLIALAQTD